MKARAFLVVARETAQGTTEAHWRDAATRAYYAAVWEAFDALTRWEAPVDPKRLHRDVRVKFDNTKRPELVRAARRLEELGQLRIRADYDLLGRFARTDANSALSEADQVLALLDEIEADPTRRQRVVEALAQVKFP